VGGGVSTDGRGRAREARVSLVFTLALRGGSKAPAFELTASDGRKISSEGLRGEKNLVLNFYPADFTAVCTKETSGFCDAHQELSWQDTEVIGFSVGNKEPHARFAEKEV